MKPAQTIFMCVQAAATASDTMQGTPVSESISTWQSHACSACFDQAEFLGDVTDLTLLAHRRWRGPNIVLPAERQHCSHAYKRAGVQLCHAPVRMHLVKCTPAAPTKQSVIA